MSLLSILLLAELGKMGASIGAGIAAVAAGIGIETSVKVHWNLELVNPK